MPERTKEVHAVSAPESGFLLQRIAGPETAKQLGVPVGSIVETRVLELTTDAPASTAGEQEEV